MDDIELTPPHMNSSPALLQTFEQRFLAIQASAPEVAKSVHNEATASVAAMMINQVKDFEDEIEASDLAKDRDTFFKYHRALSGMVTRFTKPCKALRGQMQTAIDNWRADLRRKAEADRLELEAKLRKEAEARKLKDAARIDKLQGPQAASAALSRPIEYTPPPIALPKIDNVIWKKIYTVQIDNPRQFLAAFAEAAPDAVINESYVTINVPKLERLAAQRDGKLSWPGLSVFEGEKGQTQRRSA